MRTYKGNSESASSNIASAKSIDNLSWILEDFKNQKSGLFGSMLGSTILVVALILGLIFLFIVGLIVAYFLLFKKKNNPPSPPPPAASEKPK